MGLLQLEGTARVMGGVCIEGMGKRAACFVQELCIRVSCASYGGLEVGQASESWGEHSTSWPGEETQGARLELARGGDTRLNSDLFPCPKAAKDFGLVS